MTDIFKGSFEEFLTPKKPPVVKSELMKKMHNFANKLALEDSVERYAKKYPVESVVLGPNLDKIDEWIITVTYKDASSAPAPSASSLAMIMGGGPSGPTRKQAYFGSFVEGDAFLEKNKWFGLKNTKYVEGVYASWDA